LASGAFALGGLADFGREAVKELNRLKIATDLSHINNEGFFEAVELAKYPFVSHAGLNCVCSHKRNLSDIQIREIAAKNGIIGICFYPEFLGGTDILEKIYKCIYNILDMGYEDNIALGSDFDGAVMSKEIFCVKDVPRLYGYLKNRGIDDRILYKIFFGNSKNFFSNLTYGGI
jgi:membrane dipeptidase